MLSFLGVGKLSLHSVRRHFQTQWKHQNIAGFFPWRAWWPWNVDGALGEAWAESIGAALAARAWSLCRGEPFRGGGQQAMEKRLHGSWEHVFSSNGVGETGNIGERLMTLIFEAEVVGCTFSVFFLCILCFKCQGVLPKHVLMKALAWRNCVNCHVLWVLSTSWFWRCSFEKSLKARFACRMLQAPFLFVSVFRWLKNVQKNPFKNTVGIDIFIFFSFLVLENIQGFPNTKPGIR